jgi:hypothetical protein
MTYKTLYWKLDSAAQTPLKTRCSGRESSFCSTYITCRVTLAKYLVISHEGMRTGLWLLETEYIRGHQCHSYSITVNQVIYFSFDLIISGLSISIMMSNQAMILRFFFTSIFFFLWYLLSYILPWLVWCRFASSFLLSAWKWDEDDLLHWPKPRKFYLC